MECDRGKVCPIGRAGQAKVEGDVLNTAHCSQEDAEGLQAPKDWGVKLKKKKHFKLVLPSSFGCSFM